MQNAKPQKTAVQNQQNFFKLNQVSLFLKHICINHHIFIHLYLFIESLTLVCGTILYLILEL